VISRRTSTLLACCAFAALTFLPIWTVFYVGPMEATGEYGSLWTALAELPRQAANSSWRETIMRWQMDNLITLAICVTGFVVVLCLLRARAPGRGFEVEAREK
jgi:hypothetical protein